MVRPFLKWCMEKDIMIEVQLVKSSEDLADGPSRWLQDKGHYTLNKNLFQRILYHFSRFYKSHSGYVCQPRKSSITKICGSLSTLGSNGSGCPKMPLGKNKGMLLQPPMESNKPMVTPLERKQAPQMPNDNSLLGFKSMVAPDAENAGKGHPGYNNTPVL